MILCIGMIMVFLIPVNAFCSPEYVSFSWGRATNCYPKTVDKKPAEMIENEGVHISPVMKLSLFQGICVRYHALLVCQL
ncbi:hypothetical protein CI610_00839 [invertebrate metagenome]|uniref:Uncharacterized protein n=1 Tax=invertebrate metagenome TaxID=1711999 RepID=A0A2H9TAG3_9ZZZZ